MSYVDMIVDGQWGSSGKGKLAGLLCHQNAYDFAVCDFAPNAGHTHIQDGRKYVYTQLPVAHCFGIPCLVGPHAAINPENFFREIAFCPETPVYVHPMASVIYGSDRHREQEAAGHIANTAKGGHASYARKLMRGRDASLVRDDERFKPYVADTAAMAQKYVEDGKIGLIESAQGFDLSLHYGTQYPYVTGRDCLPGRMLDNAGLPVHYLNRVFGSIRSYPIRVGNTKDGWSGPQYPDQQELSWGELGVQEEITTVTGRVRRVFSFSWLQLERFIRFVRPTDMFLNFANYWAEQEREEKIEELRSFLTNRGVRLAYVGTGPDLHDYVDVEACMQSF